MRYERKVLHHGELTMNSSSSSFLGAKRLLLDLKYNGLNKTANEFEI